MKIKVYQADIEAENKFMDYEFTNRVCGGVNKDDYHLVFDGHIKAFDLEDAWVIFNSVARPEGFTGHSLSVSDILVTEDGAFYVDSVGFRKIEF